MLNIVDSILLVEKREGERKVTMDWWKELSKDYFSFCVANTSLLLHLMLGLYSPLLPGLQQLPLRGKLYASYSYLNY